MDNNNQEEDQRPCYLYNKITSKDQILASQYADADAAMTEIESGIASFNAAERITKSGMADAYSTKSSLLQALANRVSIYSTSEMDDRYIGNQDTDYYTTSESDSVFVNSTDKLRQQAGTLVFTTTSMGVGGIVPVAPDLNLGSAANRWGSMYLNQHESFSTSGCLDLTEMLLGGDTSSRILTSSGRLYLNDTDILQLYFDAVQQSQRLTNLEFLQNAAAATVLMKYDFIDSSLQDSSPNFIHGSVAEGYTPIFALAQVSLTDGSQRVLNSVNLSETPGIVLDHTKFSFGMLSGGFAFSFFANLAGGDEQVVFKAESATQSLVIKTKYGNRLSVVVSNGVVETNLLSDLEFVLSDTWALYTVSAAKSSTINGYIVALYRNSTEAGLMKIDNQAIGYAPLFSSSADVATSASLCPDAGASVDNGSLAEFVAFKRPLPQGEISELYKNGFSNMDLYGEVSVSPDLDTTSLVDSSVTNNSNDSNDDTETAITNNFGSIDWTATQATEETVVTVQSSYTDISGVASTFVTSSTTLGTLYVYTKDSEGQWSQTATVSETDATNFGATCSVNTVGNVVAVSSDEAVYFYDVTSGSLTPTGSISIDGAAATVLSVELNSVGNVAAVLDDSGSMQLYENTYSEATGWVALGSAIEVLGSQIAGFDVNNTGYRLAVVLSTGAVRVFDMSSLSPIQLGSDIVGQNGFASVSLSADGSRVAAAANTTENADGRIEAYDFDGSVWVLVGGPIVGSASQKLGESIDISGNGLIIASVDLTHTRLFYYDANFDTWYQVSGSATAHGGLPVTVSLDTTGSFLTLTKASGVTSVYSYNVSADPVGESESAEPEINDSNYQSMVITETNSIGTNRNIVALSDDGSRVIACANNLPEAYVYNVSDLSQIGNTITPQSAYSSSTKFNFLSINSDGSRVCVSDDAYNNAIYGYISIYELSGNTWTHLQSYLGDISFGSRHSMNRLGTVVSASAYKNNSFKGLLKVYKQSSSTGSWAQLGQTLTGTATNAWFGYFSVLSPSGTSIVVGETNAAGLQGAVYVYRLDGGLWVRQESYMTSGISYTKLGRAIDANDYGNVVIAGSLDSGESNYAGRAFVFEFVNGAWQQKGSSFLGDNSTGRAYMSQYSNQVNAKGDLICISERGYSNSTGRVRMFFYDTAVQDWVQLGETLTGKQNSDNFGTFMSLSGDGKTLAVGSLYNGLRIFKIGLPAV